MPRRARRRRSLPCPRRQGPRWSLPATAAPLAVLFGLLLAAPGPLEPAGAQGPDPATVPDPATIGDDRLSPTVLSVPVTSPAYDRARVAWSTTTQQLAQAQATHAAAVRAIDELGVQEQRLSASRDAASAREAEANARVDTLQQSVQAFAVTVYVHGGPQLEASGTVDWQDATEHQSRRAITEAAVERQLAALADAVGDRDRARRERDRTGAVLEATQARQREAVLLRDGALTAAFLLAARQAEEAEAVADERLTAWVVGADFQLVALDAYVKASEHLAVTDPACGLRWEILAGISRTEGRHGTWAGNTLGATGVVTPGIIGIPLDGTRGTARVADSDGGRLDGDSTFDRAVGPMQFLPSTWTRFGSDADGDGTADPQNLYDATRAAGALLCHAAHGLGDEEAVTRALLAYNVSDEYGRVVRERIAGYDSLRLPPDG